MTNVPKQYQQYVTDAAKTTGMPESVVAAQINLESSFNPNAVSPAGAQGIAQFMPGTWKEYGSGSPFDAGNAFTAYSKYMAALLKEEGGSVRKALEAYNAGPGNLPAGAGYATEILNAAGSGDVTVSGTGSTPPPSSGTKSSGGGLLDWPGDIISFFKDGTESVTSTLSFFHTLFQPSSLVRMGAGLFGVVFLLFALVFLFKETKNG